MKAIASFLIFLIECMLQFLESFAGAADHVTKRAEATYIKKSGFKELFKIERIYKVENYQERIVRLVSAVP